ncbi:hypothetical protein H4R33_005410, partial [Dimargaris cristalligena]
LELGFGDQADILKNLKQHAWSASECAFQLGFTIAAEILVTETRKYWSKGLQPSASCGHASILNRNLYIKRTTLAEGSTDTSVSLFTNSLILPQDLNLPESAFQDSTLTNHLVDE